MPSFIRLADAVYPRNRQAYYRVITPVVDLFAGGSRLLFDTREPDGDLDPVRLCNNAAELMNSTSKIIKDLAQILADGQIDAADRSTVEDLTVNARVLASYLRDLCFALKMRVAIAAAEAEL